MWAQGGCTKEQVWPSAVTPEGEDVFMLTLNISCFLLIALGVRAIPSCDPPALNNQSLQGLALLSPTQTHSLEGRLLFGDQNQASPEHRNLSPVGRNGHHVGCGMAPATWGHVAAWPGQPLRCEVRHRWTPALSTALWVSHLPLN